ncbi:MAG: SRPBCC domain-containing protein [Aliishimia sp.]
MTTDTAEFKFQRKFTISPDQLWHLVTDPSMRGRWNSPSDDMTMTLVCSDLRAGGLERHRCGPEAAPEFEVETKWYWLDAPTNAAFTETVEAGGASVATSLVTYRITALDSGSELHVNVAVSSFCGPEAPMEFSAGWDTALAKLEVLAK